MRYVSWPLLLFRPTALRPLKTLHVHAVGGYLLRHRQDLADQPVIQRVRHGVLCSRYARETLIGFPLRVRLSARRRPLLQRKSAHQKGTARRGGHFWCGHGDSNPNARAREPKGYVTLVKDFQSPPYHKGRASFPRLQKIFRL